MNRFIRLGNIILNLDHVIEIRFELDALEHRHDGKDEAKRRPALCITTSEITPGDYGTESRVLRFLDDDALSAWDFLRSVLHEING